MPKKKMSKAVESKKNAVDVTNGNLDFMEVNDIPDEETLQKMKDKLLSEKPELKHLFQYMEKTTQDRTVHAQDSYAVLENKRGFVTPELLLQYPNSPTARDAMEALNHFFIAFEILWGYPKPRALSESDCDFIQPGLHHFIEGNMMAQYLTKQFPLPKSCSDLVEDYLQLRPKDILVEYLYVKIVVDNKSNDLPDYERCKETIRALEMFAHKLLPFKKQETAKRILIDAYYMLGARYTTTDQGLRALDVFEKCYALDEKNISALYSVAFHYQHKDPEKALKLCKKYLDMAPKCDEKFPNVHYIMGYIYAIHFKDIDLATKYYHLGKEAEKVRLPFNTPTEFLPKTWLESFMPMAESNRGMLLKSLEHIDMEKIMQESL